MESTEYKVLVNKCNELIDKHNALCNDYDTLIDKHNALCNDYDTLVNKHNMLSEYVNTMATVVTFLLVDYIEKIPDEKAKDLATKFKGILTSRLEKVSHAE